MRLWGSICVALALLGSNEPIGGVINHLFVLFFNPLGIKNCLPQGTKTMVPMHQSFGAWAPIFWCPFKLTNRFSVLIWKIKIGNLIFGVFYVSLYVLHKNWFYYDIHGINECAVPQKPQKGTITMVPGTINMVPPNVTDWVEGQRDLRAWTPKWYKCTMY